MSVPRSYAWKSHRHTLTNVLFESNAPVSGTYIKPSPRASVLPGSRQIPDVGIDLSYIDRWAGANHISVVHYLSIVSHSLLLPDSGATYPPLDQKTMSGGEMEMIHKSVG